MLRLPEFAGHPRRTHAALGPRRLAGRGRDAPDRHGRRRGLLLRDRRLRHLAQAAGLLGAEALAAYTILHNVETTVFMVGLGISVATAVRVGQAAGAGDATEARAAGLAGLAAAMGLVGAARPRAPRRGAARSSASTAPTRR